MSAVIVSISVLVIVLAVMSVRFVVMSVVMTESVVSLAVMSVWGIRLLVIIHIIKSYLSFRILSLPRFLFLNPSVLSNLNKCVLPYGKLISSFNFLKSFVNVGLSFLL